MSEPITKKFLYDMVEVDFFPWRNIERDTTGQSIANQINKDTDSQFGDFPYSYGQLVAYTQDMRFSWKSDAPEHYLALETWWNMRQEGEPMIDCFLFYAREISNPVTYGWQKQFTTAHKIYVPVEEEQPKFDEEGNPVDPNSSAAKKSGGKKSGRGSEK